MSDLLALLERLSGFGANTLVPALLLAGMAIVVIRRWQATLPLMVVMYCLLTLVLTLSMPAGIALLYGAAGIVSCLVLSVAAQRAGVPDVVTLGGGRSFSLRLLSTPLLLRATGVIFVILISFGLLQRFPLLGVQRPLEIAAVLLFGLGALLLATTRDALAHGQAMLIMLAGVSIGSAALEPGASVATVLAFVTVLFSTVAAYLTLADSDAIIEENRGA